MTKQFEYDEAESKHTERIYLSPEVVRQRMRTLEILAPTKDEHIMDIGCGPGLLAHDLALEVGPGGRVTGMDSSSSMLELARIRCAPLSHVKVVEGDAVDLPADDASLNAVTCTQVLLYVEDVEAAIVAMHRVLEPGGRAVIVETDWRSAVINSSDPGLTERMIAAWDAAVPSPNLPACLGPILRARGFAAVRVEAFPILSTHARDGGYAASMTAQFARSAFDSGAVTAVQRREWLDDLARLDDEGGYFFCVNRFIFSAIRA